MRTRILCALCVAAIGCGSATKVAAPAPGEIIGHVEISQDVAATGCQVVLEGTPLGARCDENGEFDIKRVPAGRWDLRILTDGGAASLPAKRVAAGANSGQVSDLGPVRLARPGSVGGHVVNSGGMDLSLAIVAVPEEGVVTVPNTNNGFLLDAVSPGNHEVVLITDAGTVVLKNVNVLPGKVTIGADLDLMTLTPNMVAVDGRALRAAANDGEHAGISVELVESLNGTTVDHATTAADGTFQLHAKFGTYIVRAKDGANPITAIVPSVVVRGSNDVHLSTALAVHKDGGDLNGDGIPDSMDPDIDGDGVPNMMDAFPFDPAESKDSDGDGVGDRADLRSTGGPGIDHKNATPDTDMDGKLDFEDNCPKKPNPDQKDIDGDGVGDVCDNCPTVPNPDQADSVGNGIGDACRFCKQNVDCGAGKICQFGQCVDCLTNSQCGEKVCDVAAGKCVPCNATNLCGGAQHCTGDGRCVVCLQTGDCPVGNACVQNSCLPQCTVDSNCLSGQFCVKGACSQCRSTADCPGTQYCDNGLCKNQCLTTNDCSGGKACDPSTHTCVLPCQGICMNGQTCVGSVCLTICNQTQPCPMGQVCSVQGVCGPECMTTPDCAAKPFTVCQAGTCVASGNCATDLDCPTSQICSVAVGMTMGSCVPRPTTMDVNGKFTCAKTCDCRTGEICTSGECEADPLGKPTRFLSSKIGTAGGDGKSPATASSTLGPLGTAATGDVVAIDAQQTLNITAPQTINAAGVTLAGGYVVCATNRWVRDDALRSTIANTSTTGKGALTLLGSPTVPLTNVVVRAINFTLADSQSMSVTWRGIDATWAPGLTLEHLLFSFQPMGPNSNRIVQGAFCTNCAGVTWDDLSTPGVSQPSFSGDVLHFVELVAGSGSIKNVHVGACSLSELWGVRVLNAVGNITIDKTTADGYAGVGSNSVSMGLVRVENVPNGLVTITGSQLPFGNTANGGPLANIFIKSVTQFLASGNLLDGSAIALTSSFSTQYGFWIEDSNGVADTNTVKLPQLYSNGTLYGFHIAGPQGGVTVSNNKVSGGIAANVTLVDIQNPNITSGPAIIKNNDLSNQGTHGLGIGLFSRGNNFGTTPAVFLTDNLIHVGAQTSGNNPQLIQFIIDSSSVRIERNKLSTGAGYTVGPIVRNGSVMELYDNYLFNGINGNVSQGLEIDDPSLVIAIGNTIDAGGAPSQGTSRGLDQNGTASNPATVFVSNLISSGRSSTHSLVYCNSNNTCFNAVQANQKDNYFWLPGTPGTSESVYSLTGGSPSVAPPNGNLVDTAMSNGCADPATADWHILASSVCIDKGATGTRRDGTAIVTDVDGAARTLGAAPDIGCSEKQ